MDVGIQYSAALATVSCQSIAMGTTSSLSTGLAAAFNTAMFNVFGGNFADDANTNCFCWIKGVVITGANAGNITIQALKSVTGTATVYIGSRMTVTLLA